MASPVLRFEVLLPFGSDSVTTSDQTAISAFMQSMGALLRCQEYQTTNVVAPNQQYTTVFGYITTAQQATALGYLNTLNAALSPLWVPVLCAVWGATTQP